MDDASSCLVPHTKAEAVALSLLRFGGRAKGGGLAQPPSHGTRTENADVSSTTQALSDTPSPSRPQHGAHDDSGSSTVGSLMLGRLVPRVKSNSSSSTLVSRQDVTPAVVSLRWLLEHSDAAQRSRDVPTVTAKSCKAPDDDASPLRLIQPAGLTEAENLDNEAVFAIGMLREWGEKEKEELLLRNPILGQYAATEPDTPLSAVLTGFATPLTPASEKGAAPVGGFFHAAPPRGTTTTTSARNTRPLARHVSLDEVVTVTNVKTIAPRSKRFLHCSHTVRSATTEERPLFKETIDAGAAAPLEVDDVLSRGLCGRDDHFTENSAEERRQRRFNRVEKRALQLSNVLSQCHFFGAADVLQVLQGEPEKSGDADAPLTSCLEPKDLSRSVIGHVVALADRSLRRRAGDDDWDTFASDDDDELAGDKTESFSLLGNTVDPYNSAADELCSVMDLGRMAAACAELDDYLKPSTATEVTT